MIPATYLNTHQQGCKDIYRKNDIFGKLNSSFEEEKAECDLCGKLYPISNLDSHEVCINFNFLINFPIKFLIYLIIFVEIMCKNS